jgi:hypothetical protein
VPHPFGAFAERVGLTTHRLLVSGPCDAGHSAWAPRSFAAGLAKEGEDELGDFTPDALTGVFSRCCLRNSAGGGYNLLHDGAAVERRDATEEAGSSGRGTAEFPGITESWSPFESSGIKTGYGGRLVSRETRQLRRDGEPDEDKA